MPFADQVRKLEAEYQRLKGQVGAGALTEAECKAKLAAMMIEDEQGRWWTIGYETGQWYRHDGEKWVGPELPPITEQPVPTPRVIKPIWIGGGIGALVLLVVLALALPRLGWFGGLAAIPTPSPTAPQPTNTLVLPTPTPAPLLTATLVPPTATSVPPAATLVPPTATSIPPTATQVPPTATPTSTSTATPTSTPTATWALPTPSPRPGSYGVPLLVAPANGQGFSEATQSIGLSWQAVGDLAADEFYDVYLTWRSGGRRAEKHWYRQETRFVVGREYFGLSDDGRYEWNVVVRRGQSPDAVLLSPISEQRFFLWPRPEPPATWTPSP